MAIPIPPSAEPPAQATSPLQAAQAALAAQQAKPSGDTSAAAPPASPTPDGQTPAEGHQPVAAAPPPSTTPTPDSDPEELQGYTDEQLKAAYRSLPPEIRKANNKIFTERTMKLSAREKELAGKEKIFQVLQSNPKEFLKALAAQTGLKVVEEPIVATPDPEEALLEEMAPFFGGDKDTARKFVPVLHKVAERVVAPLKQVHEESVVQAKAREAEASVSAFAAKHPDWKQHEAAMAEVMNLYRPGPNVSDGDYLEMAYTLVTRDQRSAQQAQGLVDKIAAAAAHTSGQGSQAATGADVSDGPPSEFPSPAQAARAALQGKKWS